MKKTLLNMLSSAPFGIMAMSLIFMWHMPFGTFDYTKFGFYLAIIQAVFTELAFKWSFRKYQERYAGKLK